MREYGSGTTIGEWTNRLGRSSRKPLVPRHQLRRRLSTRGRSLKRGGRTPVFSMNSTRCPLGGEPRHDLLVALPDEVPVDRRDADDVVLRHAVLVSAIVWAGARSMNSRNHSSSISSVHN